MAAENRNAATGPPWKAVVTGCTGAIGKYLVAELLNHPETWSNIVTIGRRRYTQEMVPADYTVNITSEESNGRLQQVETTFEKLDNFKSAMEGADASLCCLGTTRNDAGGADAFRKIDLEFVTNIATASREMNVGLFSLVTASNAKRNSWFLYPQVKGELQDRVAELKFPHASIFQPGLLDRDQDKRTVEKIAGWFVSATHVKTVAKAIRHDAEETLRNPSGSDIPSVKYIDVKQIEEFAQETEKR